MEVGYWQRGKPGESCSLNFGQEVCGKSGEEGGGGFEYHQFTLLKTLIFGCQNIEIAIGFPHSLPQTAATAQGGLSLAIFPPPPPKC